MDLEARKRSQETAVRRRANKTNGEEAHRRSALVSAWLLRLDVEKYMRKACPAKCPDSPDMYLDDEPETDDIAHEVHAIYSASLAPQTNAEETQSKVSSGSDSNRHESKHPKNRRFVAGMIGALKSLRFPMSLRGVRLPRRTSMTRVRPFRDEHLNSNTRNSGVSRDEEDDKEEVRVNNLDVDVRGTMRTRRFASRGRSADSQGFNCIGPKAITARWHRL
eukprot:TRINITY_DN24378_c0_g2_i1.p1 TRINITY_DN24378_c0_g2~~TRINITY_DN24378_c0_g2_i1.p1  ORF type:complete len:227 (+),score=22.82 TRINITY_DN24378_c0_g2_i1:23-682(+)